MQTNHTEPRVLSLLSELGYLDSPRFLDSGRAPALLPQLPEIGHVLRRGFDAGWLVGAYVLHPSPQKWASAPAIPAVYVCKAEDEAEANEVHRWVWNQSIAPFVLVASRDAFRLYSGFRYGRKQRGEKQGLLEVLHDTVNALSVLRAEAIDGGELWQTWGNRVYPEDRVDNCLLRNLELLGKWLREQGGLERRVAHALIGKYVYLRYLRDRGFLSDAKLAAWEISEADVFGRDVRLSSLLPLLHRLEVDLNGQIFPIDWNGAHAPREEHVRAVASTFKGDERKGDSWQLHLDFQAYDFSYLPIETLSAVYQQFLHATDGDGHDEERAVSRGRKTGAYYTPVPLVNFMLSEMEEHQPLREGMRVLDPSCGSGAFLVQCYRRLIEKVLLPHTDGQPTPPQLRDLLVKHIHGVDRDEDACRVTELSLFLTLLDYVKPPDLMKYPAFKLPNLRIRNIYCSDFFQKDAPWRKTFQSEPFHWVVGNPPWVPLNPDALDPLDEPAWQWMRNHRKECRLGGNQVAQAFLWECAHYVQDGGQIGFLMPAMTLLDTSSRYFRRGLVGRYRMRVVANFSNLARVLFGGKPETPAAALFCSLRANAASEPEAAEQVRVYTPFVVNQVPTRPAASGSRGESWSIVVNASEIRDIPMTDLAEGESLPWKLAMWGSPRDRRLLAKLGNCQRYATIGDLETRRVLVVSEGLQARPEGADEDVEPLPVMPSRKTIAPKELRGGRGLFVFPPELIENMKEELTHVRTGRAELPLAVSEPPHIIVSAARSFAVFSDEFLIVPPRQIGVHAAEEHTALLKALALYLSSDIAFYHQFMTSTELGIKRARATLNSFRQIPIPKLFAQERDLGAWVSLHGRLVAASLAGHHDDEPLFNAVLSPESMPALLAEVNAMVYDALDLDEQERALVEDFVKVRQAVNDGQVGEKAVGCPGSDELQRYAEWLLRELDGFVTGGLEGRHRIEVLHDRHGAGSGMVAVHFEAGPPERPVKFWEADDEAAKALRDVRERLLVERAQWVYFNRSLRVYEGRSTYLFKPMQHLHWTRSQAVDDAREIIAGIVAGRGDGS